VRADRNCESSIDVRYTLEIDLALTVEVLEAVRGAEATRDTPAEPDEIELCVRLGALDITEALPLDVVAYLELDALERLRRAADEP
jgi:hypothetical protein